MFSTRYAPSKREVITPDKSIRRLIVGDKQRCLACKVFIVKISKAASKFANLQPRNRPYIHAAGCPQIGRF